LSFLHPEFLYFMFIPLFVLFGFLLTQKETETHFFSSEVMEKLRVGAKSMTLKSRNILFLFMAIFIIVALGQPVIDNGVVKIQSKSADIMIAFDISDSMLAEDVYPNRLKLAKQKAIDFLNIVPNDRVGVIGFARNSYLVSPVSFDHDVVSFLLSKLDTNSITEKGTDFLSMLEVVNKDLKNDKKYLLLITDGGDKKDFSKEITYAKKSNITVFILGIGTKHGAPIKQKDGSFIKYKGDIVVSKLNESISQLATSTGGVYIQNVKSDKDVKAMLKEIKNKAIKKELKSEEVHKYISLFYYPLGVALLLLLIATSSFVGKKRTGASILGILLLLFTPNLKAGIFDFIELDKAKKAYENGEYKKASKLYGEYAKRSNDPKGYYDKGDALYKQKKYKEALKAYQKANFTDKDLRAKTLANMGNAYAKQMTMPELQKAKEAYENSLKLKEDKDVRENLKEVKKLLKKKQNKSQKKNDKKKDKKQNQNKDSKSSDKNKNNKSDKNKNEKSDKKKSNQQKQKQKGKKSDKDENSSDKQKEKNDLKKLSKSKEKKKTNKQEKALTGQQKQKISQKKMSDTEELKWLKELNKQKTTYLYRLNSPKTKEENNDEKPW